MFYYSSGTTGTTSGTVSFNFFTSVSTTSTSIAPMIAPLRPPKREACPGWLAPDGSYYACNYAVDNRHGETATAIMTDLLEMDVVGFDGQLYLQNNGWIRVDYDSVMGSVEGITPKQLATLRFLMKLVGNDSWINAKWHIREFIRGVKKVA